MLAAVLSLHEQVIFMPPEHFSILIVQRGTMTGFIMVGALAVGAPMPACIIPGMPITVGLTIVVIMASPW
jgi:hypothetical protein